MGENKNLLLKGAMTYKNGMLEKVALPLDIVYTYTYGSNGRIIEVVNAREIHAVKNEYERKYKCKLNCIKGCNARIKFTERKNNIKFFSTWNKE